MFCANCFVMNLFNRLQLRVYLFWAVIIGLIILAAAITLPFVGAIVAAYVLAYLLKPLFLRLKPSLGATFSAILCIIITVVVIVVPIGLISIQILNQIGGVSSAKGITSIVDGFVAQPFLKSLSIDTSGINEWITTSIGNLVSSTIASIPHFFISLVITLNGMFYLLCNWDKLSLHLKNYLPFSNNDKMITRLGGTADAIIHGHVLIALLEGVIAFVGFSLVGVQASLIFAVLVFILAFVPSVGPLLIWGALALYYFSIQQYATMWGIIATGLVLMVGIEFYFYTRFVGSRSHIHPFIMLIGVLGGISVFGIFGFIIGPLVLANSIRIIEGAVETQESRRAR